ncbi:MAG: hypothetical protein GY719_06515 [bacterium]|nr:hypothetical protein [bacterium]
MSSAEQTPRFVVCTRNEGSDDLNRRKIYRVLPDASAAEEGLLRIVDDSGEDYLYPTDFFAAIDLPRDLEKALRLAS